MYIYKMAGTNKLSPTRFSPLVYDRAYCDRADDHYVLHNHVLCAKNGCKSLSSSEVKKYS